MNVIIDYENENKECCFIANVNFFTVDSGDEYLAIMEENNDE